MDNSSLPFLLLEFNSESSIYGEKYLFIVNWYYYFKARLLLPLTYKAFNAISAEFSSFIQSSWANTTCDKTNSR